MDAPYCRMSLLQDDSMRFRWNEENPNRLRYFEERDIRPPLHGYVRDAGKTLVSVELIHSKTVYAAEVVPASAAASGAGSFPPGTITMTTPDGAVYPLHGLRGDGIITTDRRLVPCVTVADCMPLWLSDEASGVFGVVHSGWKGTGIVVNALEFAAARYGLRKSSVRVVMGPHIRSCCYTVDAERAAYFSQNFTSDCVSPVAIGTQTSGLPQSAAAQTHGSSPPPASAQYRLSLEKANLALLLDWGVSRDHITLSDDCTSCTRLSFADKAGGGRRAAFKYGSFRRETANLPPDMPLPEKQKHFTVMAAYTVAE